MRIILVIVFMAFTGLLGLSSGVDHFFRIAYLLAIILATSWLWTHYCLANVSVNFKGSTTNATVGQIASAQVEVYNDGTLPKFWLEMSQESDLPQPFTPHILHLPGDQMRTFRTEFKCERRGRFTIGPSRVAGGDPFGLFRKELVSPGTHSLVVYPRTEELDRFNLPPADLPGEGRYRRRTHFVTPNASGIREYVYGDSYNRIHWPSTARTGKMMVKEFELDPASETWIMLDLHRDVHVGEGLESTEEYAVTAAASVAKHYLGVNRPIGLMCYGSYLAVHPPERSGHQLLEIMETLAMAKAVGPASLAELLAGETRRFGRFSTLLIITPSTDERWIQQLQHLIRRGARPAAVLLEPSTFGGSGETLQTVSGLVATGIQLYLLKQGMQIRHALASADTGETART